ncbi:MAG: hypothetical protein HY430_01330 [Candidatus Levybacteria bacterium]|nr:hypothetical protein [Candidatus Levybacteria bacterium]
MNFCSKSFISAAAIVTISLFLPATALAAAPDGLGPWADTVSATSQGLTKGGGAVPAIRSDPTSALGVAENNTTDGNFYSLGFGGSITLGFDNGISSGVIVVEATNPGYPAEKAKVEVSEDGVSFVDAGTVTQDGQVDKPAGITCARYVRITDTSNPDDFAEATADAYDVDGVQAQGDPCTPPSNGDGNGSGGDCIISQTNKTKVTTVVNATANSGDNTTNDNTGGNVTITTNPASNTVDVSVTGGSNTATGCGCCCNGGGDTTAIISGNGQGSTNTISIGSKKKVKPVVLKLAKKKLK